MSNVDEPAARSDAAQTSAPETHQRPAPPDVAPSLPAGSSDISRAAAPDALRTAPVIAAIEALVRGVRQQLDATSASGQHPRASVGDPATGSGAVLASQLDAAEAQLRRFRQELDREGSARSREIEPPLAHLEAHIRQVRRDLRADSTPRADEPHAGPPLAEAGALPLGHISPAETLKRRTIWRAPVEPPPVQAASVEQPPAGGASFESPSVARSIVEHPAIEPPTAGGLANVANRRSLWPWFAAAAALVMAATLASWLTRSTLSTPVPSTAEVRLPAPSPSAFPDSTTVPESLTRAVEDAVATSLVEPTPIVTESELEATASPDTGRIDPAAPVEPVAPVAPVTAPPTSDTRHDVDVDVDARREAAPVDIDATPSIPTAAVADAGITSAPVTNDVPPSEPSAVRPSIPQPRNDVAEAAPAPPAAAAPAIPAAADANVLPTSLTRPATVVNRVQPRMLVEVVSSDMMAAPVDVQVSIDRTGRLTAARAMSGPVALRAPAEDTVRHWTFSPALQEGEPVDSTLRVTLTFGPATRDMRFRRR